MSITGMLLLIPSVNKQNIQIETISSGIERFSGGQNHTMTTIVYLKNENLLISCHAIGSLRIDRARVHYSTMFDAKPNIPMGK